jgi:hypothetical protein
MSGVTIAPRSGYCSVLAQRSPPGLSTDRPPGCRCRSETTSQRRKPSQPAASASRASSTSSLMSAHRRSWPTSSRNFMSRA